MDGSCRFRSSLEQGSTGWGGAGLRLELSKPSRVWRKKRVVFCVVFGVNFVPDSSY